MEQTYEERKKAAIQEHVAKRLMLTRAHLWEEDARVFAKDAIDAYESALLASQPADVVERRELGGALKANDALIRDIRHRDARWHDDELVNRVLDKNAKLIARLDNQSPQLTSLAPATAIQPEASPAAKQDSLPRVEHLALVFNEMRPFGAFTPRQFAEAAIAVLSHAPQPKPAPDARLIPLVEGLKSPDYLPAEYRLVFNGAIDTVLETIRQHAAKHKPAPLDLDGLEAELSRHFELSEYKEDWEPMSEAANVRNIVHAFVQRQHAAAKPATCLSESAENERQTLPADFDDRAKKLFECFASGDEFSGRTITEQELFGWYLPLLLEGQVIGAAKPDTLARELLEALRANHELIRIIRRNTSAHDDELVRRLREKNAAIIERADRQLKG